MLRHCTVLTLATVLLGFLIPAESARGDLTWPHWDRTAAAGQGDFLLAANWTTHVPGSSETCSIDNGGTALFGLLADDEHTVRSLYLGFGNNNQSGFLNHVSGTLNVTNGLILSAAIDPTDPATIYEARYTLNGGTLDASSCWVYGAGTAVFSHYGGTAAVSGLNIGNDLHFLGPYGGTYEIGDPDELDTPLLMTSSLTVSSLGLLDQTGGDAETDFYTLTGTHRFSGGTFTVNHGWVHTGTLDFLGSGTTLQAANALVDLSQGGIIANGGAASFTSGPKSMVMLPAGFDPSVFGGGFNPGNLTHTVGTTMTMAADQEWWGWGAVPDHVTCAGIIDADGGWIDLLDGVNVDDSGIVDLGNGDVVVEDLTSGMTGGTLMGSYMLIGRTTPGAFTMSGGTCSVYAVRISEEGDGDGSADGTLSVSGDAVLNSTSGIWIGFDGNGTYVQSGGTVTTDTFTVGFDYADWANVTLTGGHLKTGAVRIAAEGRGTVATVTHSDGHWETSGFMNMATVQDTVATYDLSGDAILDSAQLTVTSNGVGTFNQSGNSVHNLTGTIQIYGDADAEGRYNMVSGQLDVGVYISLYGSGLAEFNHTGGTVTTAEVRAGGGASSYQTAGFGTYNLGGTGVLVAEEINVGKYVNGEFIQTGGTCTVNGPLSVGTARNYYGNLGEGTYELGGTGPLATADSLVGVAGVGTFDHLASSHTITGALLVGCDATGIGTYNLNNGTVSESEAVVGFSGTGTFNQTLGTHTVNGPLVLGHEETGDGTYTINGGTLSATDLTVGRDWVEVVVPPAIPDESHGTGTLIIGNAAASITVSNLLHVGQNGTIQSVPGSVIHMTGSVFENESVDPEALAGMENLELVFEGGAADVDTFEVAGKALDAAGEDTNFVLGELTIGGADVGHVQLVDEVDNQPGWVGDEVLHVRRLTVGAGSVLDLNGRTLYCDEMDIDPAATVMGGTPIIPGQIPVAASLDSDWVYQNTDGATAWRHWSLLTLTIDDTSGNTTYDVTVEANAASTGSVVIEPTGDPLVWRIKGGRRGTDPIGDVPLDITVSGVEVGGAGTATGQVTVRLLGDVNGNLGVDTADKLELNRHMNGVATPYGVPELDLNGDGVVDTQDKLIVNQILNGIDVP